MKIGEFSRKFNTSIDTVRFYVESGLLLPEKIHNQRNFDSRCVSDMEEIQKYKDMKFTIADIKKIFSLRRLTGFLGEHRGYYLEMLGKKERELNSEADTIRAALSMVDIERNMYNQNSEEKKSKSEYGIPLPFLSMTACPSCGKGLILDKAGIENNNIMTGDLSCECGYTCFIKDGIIVVGDKFDSDNDVPDLYKLFKNIYTQENDEDLERSFRTHDWYTRRIDFNNLDNKVVLRWGTGQGVLLRTFVENVKSFENSYYLATDNNYQLLKKVKEFMENTCDKRISIIFIAAKYDEIPLKNSTADMVIDTFSSSDLLLERGISGVERVKQYLKKGGMWYGGYVYINEPYPNVLYRYIDKLGKFSQDNVENLFDDMEKLSSSKISEFQLDTEELFGVKTQVDAVYWMYNGKKV